MLTADLVRARRRGGELVLVKLDAESRGRALAIAESVLGAARAQIGGTREDLEGTIAAIDVEPRDERLKAGLVKLVDDRCAFEADESMDAEELRKELFLRAAAARRALPLDARFDRAKVVAAFAAERGIDAGAVERGLFADLRGAHVLQGLDAISAPSLVEEWERGQAQAVLLRAVSVTVDVACASPGAARALFHRLKFLRLLHTIEKTEDGYRLVIDGPFSLFEASTKYGLQLALVLPVLEGCEAWKLVASVRWGAERTPLVFRLEGGARGAPGRKARPVRLPDEVAALVAGFERLATGWRVTPAKAILDLPGVGLCVPDLAFERGGRVVYLEVMGYWSRDAVWRRVELVEAGLATPVLFALSSRLRVSEEVLPEGSTSGLYVYKGAMSAAAVASRIEALAERRGTSRETTPAEATRG